MTLSPIRTARLDAVPITENYLEEIHLLHSDPEVMHFIRPPEKDLNESRYTLEEKMLKYMAGNPGLGNWAVHLKGNEAFIGWGVLKHLEDSDFIELGYRFHKKIWGNGYATEISSAIRDYGFNTLQLNRIVGITHPENLGSQRVLEKIGMEFKRMDHYYDTDVKFFEMMNPSS